MLRGKFKDIKGNLWELKGYDFQNYFEFLAKKVEPNIDLDLYKSTEEFHMLIKPTNIVYGGIKGSHNLHEEFSNLGKILFFLKSICIKKNEDGYFDIGYSETSFSSLKSYSKDLFGVNQKIKQKMGTLVECVFKSSEVGSLVLKTDQVSDRLPWMNEKYTMQYKNDLIQAEDKTQSIGVLSSFRTIEEIIKENPDKNYSYILSKDLRIVTKDTLKDVLSKFNPDVPFAVDTETDGLEVDFRKKDRLVGLILCTDENTAFYFPLRHTKFENLCEEEEIPDFLEENFKDFLENGKGIYQNGIFDWKVFYSEGIDVNIFFDTLLAFRLTLWNEDTSLRLALKPLVKRVLGHDSLELDDLVVGGWNSGTSFRDVPRELVGLYGCMDGINTYLLYKYIVKENLLEYYNSERVFKLECSFSRVVGYQEYFGHHVDIDNIPKVRGMLEKERDDLYRKMKDLVGGIDFNPSSTKSLQEILFKVLGLKPVSYTKTNQPSTDKDTLKILARQHDFPRLLLEFRNINTQINNFINKIDEIASEDGFMFSRVTQILNTGRISVSDPNYQSYSPAVKKYVTPREGYYMFDFDYSAVEYRIMSSMSHEDVLIEKFFDTDTDIHSYQASRMFGVPLLYVSHDLRSQSKGVSFGLMYGMQAKSLGGEIFGKESQENTAKASNLINLFFKGQEKVKAFFDDAQAKSYQQGWSDTYIGRRRYFNKNLYSAHKIMRMGANHRIQGTAADFFKLAMNRLFKMIKEEGWQGKVLIPFFVHDEAVLEVHNSIDPAILLKKVMECTRLYIKNWCPLVNEFGYGATWQEAKSGECPVPVQDIIIKKYGDTGLDWWNGDIKALVDFQVGEIHKWQMGRVVNYLKDENNFGKEIYAPVLKQAQSLYKDLLKNDSRGIDQEVSVDGFSFDSKNPINNLKSLVDVLGIRDLYDNASIKEESEVKQEPDSVPEPVKINEEDASVEDMLKLFGVYRRYDPDELWVLYPEDWLDGNQSVELMVYADGCLKQNKGGIKLYFMNKKGEVFEPEVNGLSVSGVVKLSKYVRLLWSEVSYANK